MVALFKVLAAPFFKVQFVHFFIADVMTSLTTILIDITSFACFFTIEDYASATHQQCSNEFTLTMLLLQILPFWIRLLQCLRRFYDDNTNINQAYNAGKYATGVIYGLFALIFGLTGDMNWLLASYCMHLLNSVYGFFWDIYMDWGLMRDSNGLREKITFSQSFYYFAIFADLILRFTWLIGLSHASEQYPWLATFEYATMLAIAELVRRWIWTIIRIENEQVSNLEKYRHILEVPELGSSDNSEKTSQIERNLSVRINEIKRLYSLCKIHAK